MKRVLPLLTLILSAYSSLASPGETYIFTGNGNWSTAANWANGRMPSNFLFGDESVIINGNCIYALDGLSSLTSDGIIRVANGGTLSIAGSQLTYLESRNKIIVEGTLIVKSTLMLYGGTVDVSGTLTNDGEISTIAASFVTVKNGGNFTNNGSLATYVTIENGGIFNNAGRMKGNVTYAGKINNAGVLAPGNSPGTIQITGEYIASSSAVHDFEVAGTAASQFDRLLVNGPVTLNGTLNVTLINGFTPSGTHDLVIFTGTISSTFSTVNLPTGYSLVYNSNNVTLHFDNVLPVTLSNFQGTIKNDKVVLNWATSFEQENLGFDIEQSSDGKTWQKIGFASGQGNSSSTNQYSFEYAGALNGKAYFRLKQIDKNGNVRYSRIVTLSIDKSELLFYPNPARSFVRFNVPQTGMLQIFDIAGRVVFKKNLTNEQTVNVSIIPSGNYMVRVISREGQIKNQKLLVE
jgi:hypothetical protein